MAVHVLSWVQNNNKENKKADSLTWCCKNGLRSRQYFLLIRMKAIVPFGRAVSKEFRRIRTYVIFLTDDIILQMLL